MPVTQGPKEPRPPRDVLEPRAKSDLRQAVWEADQYMTHAEIEAYVRGVLVEIESDRP